MPSSLSSDIVTMAVNATSSSATADARATSPVKPTSSETQVNASTSSPSSSAAAAATTTFSRHHAFTMSAEVTQSTQSPTLAATLASKASASASMVYSPPHLPDRELTPEPIFDTPSSAHVDASVEECGDGSEAGRHETSTVSANVQIAKVHPSSNCPSQCADSPRNPSVPHPARPPHVASTSESSAGASRTIPSSALTSIRVDDDEWPKWLQEAVYFFSQVGGEEAWVDCVTAYVDLLHLNGFPTSDGVLPTNGRPELVRLWVQWDHAYHKTYNRFVNGKCFQLDVLPTGFWRWWDNLQPSDRPADRTGAGTPITATHDWTKLSKFGKNGILSVMAYLAL
ncbi:hypothetical protein EWM64_g5682 [Hericium alpestre]|uniref:Uncharacterized protein n=1 Tax=Hericium alpestre TaxID=135208 RepID=A0A4Y9ZW88_9AGAM|nr:hypothetical protein EWM64_g5682 [Hericium alpestre]